MNALLLLHQDAHTDTKPDMTVQRTLAEAQIWGAILGLCGGMAAVVLGSLLTAAGWLVADAGAKHWLASAGTALLCSTMPLLLLGACCLDWLEQGNTQGWSPAGRYDAEDDEL